MERLPKKNLTAKIIALIMAIVLWVYVMNEQNPLVESSVEVALEVRNLSNSVVAADIPERVRVRVRGPRSMIVGLNPKEIKSYIDLKDLADGRNTVKVTTAVPANVELIEVSPEKINLRLDTIANRQIPVEVKLSGIPAAGGVVGKITPSVAHITVEGPAELLATAAKVVANVDIQAKTTDFSVTAPLVLIDDKGKKIEGLTVTPGQVAVSVSIIPAVSRKVVDIKPTIIGILPKGIVLSQIIINPQQVEISGDAKTLEKEEIIYTEPINLIGIEKDTTLESKIQIKEGIASSKKVVTVTISVEKKP